MRYDELPLPNRRRRGAPSRTGLWDRPGFRRCTGLWAYFDRRTAICVSSFLLGIGRGGVPDSCDCLELAAFCRKTDATPANAASVPRKTLPVTRCVAVHVRCRWWRTGRTRPSQTGSKACFLHTIASSMTASFCGFRPRPMGLPGNRTVVRSAPGPQARPRVAGRAGTLPASQLRSS